MDFSLGTKLMCHSGVIATHPRWHHTVLETVFWDKCAKIQTQWLEAIIDSKAATSAALRAAANSYDEHGHGNLSNIVQKLRAAASDLVSEAQLSSTRGEELVSILCRGSAAVELALSQHSISRAEIDFMLQLNPDTASELTARSLGREEELSCGEFSDVPCKSTWST